MAGYTIGEIAERSGFSASTLRYYEEIDLVHPTGRTEAGYRLYDNGALARLAFINRAKQLGCTLDDIRDLVAIWDHDRCAPVQRRFHALVSTKLADAHYQIDELTAFTRQLEAAAAHLAGPAADGPCADGCACTTVATAGPASRPTAVALRAKAVEPGPPAPIACTLGTQATVDRVGAWRAVLDHARARATTATGSLRIELDETADLAELARLVVAERECCSFFAFAITVDHRGVGLEVDAPDDAADLVAAVFDSAERSDHGTK